jgi:hypothetical protein
VVVDIVIGKHKDILKALFMGRLIAALTYENIWLHYINYGVQHELQKQASKRIDVVFSCVGPKQPIFEPCIGPIR